MNYLSKEKTYELYTKIPTLNTTTGHWKLTPFGHREEFTEYVLDQFKRPGEYKLKNTHLWNEHGTNWLETGVYTTKPKDTRDNIKFWELERYKCRRGVIIDDFYLPRDYYMWINFLPIYDKEAKKFKLANIWDTQYHMSLYELLAELHFKHCVILKKRQFGSSYFHMSKIINQYWFEDGSICKVGASKENYVNDSWRFLNEYRDHLNSHTEWYRNNDPNKLRDWQQREQITDEFGRQGYIGSKAIIKGTTFDKDPTAGVGGPCTIFFHEEAGIAPKADQTLQFMLPALKSGSITTGLFIAAGSVGDLQQCEPLKKMMYKPRTYDMYAVPYNLDPDSKLTESGLFIPQNWSMPPYIDSEGNSDVETAKQAVLTERERIRRDMPMQDYQTNVSQAPLTIDEAFLYRQESIFPTHLASRTRDKIIVNKRNYVCVDLDYDPDGINGVKHTFTTKPPITDYPVDVKMEDKTGSIQVFNGHFPDKDAKWGTYLAGIDPVDVGKTASSDSLFSIYIYKTMKQDTLIKSDNTKEVKIEGDEVVACWTGRFDDVNRTNERALLLIEWYQAWAVVENNIKSFIQFCQSKKKTKYLATPKDLPFVKDITASGISQYEYGVRMNVTIKNYIFEGIIDYLKEEIGEKTISEFKHIKIYGSDKIPDEMVLVEIIQYAPDKNVDRLIAFGLVVAFAKARQANGIFIKQVNYEKQPDKKVGNDNVRNIFNNIGRSMAKGALGSQRRGAFKNLR